MCLSIAAVFSRSVVCSLGVGEKTGANPESRLFNDWKCVILTWWGVVVTFRLDLRRREGGSIVCTGAMCKYIIVVYRRSGHERLSLS